MITHTSWCLYRWGRMLHLSPVLGLPALTVKKLIRKVDWSSIVWSEQAITTQFLLCSSTPHSMFPNTSLAAKAVATPAPIKFLREVRTCGVNPSSLGYLLLPRNAKRVDSNVEHCKFTSFINYLSSFRWQTLLPVECTQWGYFPDESTFCDPFWWPFLGFIKL